MRILILLLALATSAFAEHIYIAQTNLGTFDGATALNAKIYTFFNDPANWDTLVNTTNSKIGPGDTVHIVGVINIAVALQFQGVGGTVGNPITLKFDAGGQLRHPTGIDHNGLIFISGQSNVTIEGGNASPVKAAYNGTTDFRAPTGYQEDLVVFANGTGMGQVQNRMVHGDPVGSNIIIKNLWMYGQYIRTYQDPNDRLQPFAGITLRVYGNNAVIENCVQVHGETGPSMSAHTSGVQTGFRISDCLVLDCSNGIKMGAGSAQVTGAQFVRNRIDHSERWGGIANNGFHSDGIQTVATTVGGRFDFPIVAYNHIGPRMGRGGDLTSFIFLEDYVNGARIYNNICEKGAPGHSSNPVIQAGTHDTIINESFGARTIVAFNTVVHDINDIPRSNGLATWSGLLVGNIAYHTAAYWGLYDNNSYAGGPKNNWADYNLGFGAAEPGVLGTDGIGGRPPDGAPAIYSVQLWRDTTPWDDNSLFNVSPLIVSAAIPVDFHLQAASPARNLVPTTVNGFDFTTIMTDDFYGNPRGAGPWDAGAVEFSTGGPVPPTVVSSAINSTGMQFAMVMSEPVVFGGGGTGGMMVTSTGGTVTLETTPSISGSTITWDITNRVIGQAEALAGAYTQPGNGIQSTDDGADLSSFATPVITNNSTVAQAVQPQFSPVPGSYSTAQNVSMSTTTPDSTIRYTTTGVDPTVLSTLYTTPISTSVTTTYKARAFSAGYFDSPVSTGAYQIGDFIISAMWFNVPVATQTGTFTWSFRAVTSVAPNDAVVGLGDHAAMTYPDLAAIARFNSDGFIDAFNGSIGGYAALNSFPYVAGQTYDFVVTINLSTHTYSMTVVQTGGGTPTAIVNNVPFRSPSASITEIDNLAGTAMNGTLTISNMSFGSTTPPGIENINVINLRIAP